MCSPNGDGAAAAVIVSEQAARRIGMATMVRVRASVLRPGWDYAQGEEMSVLEK